MIGKLIATFFFSSILTISCFAKDGYVSGDGRFYAQDEDSLSFVKQQLLSSAFRDILGKELKSMGLNAELFWQKYDLQFDEYFAPIHDQLKADYGVKEDGDISAKKRDEYEKELRKKRLVLKSKFGRLDRAVSSYSIQKMSRSTQMANSRYLALQAKINRKMLSEIYLQFTREGEARHFKKIYLSVKFNLKDLSWNDVGVDVETDFTEVVQEHWKKWFEEKFQGVVDSIVLTDESTERELTEFLKIPSEATQMLQGQEVIGRDSNFSNSLWVKINIDLNKEHDHGLLREREFGIDGDFLIVDLKNNKVLSHYDFIKEERKFSVEDRHKLSSNMASLVYQIPLPNFEKFKADLLGATAPSQRIYLDVEGANTITDIFDFTSILNNKGVSYQFEVEVESFSKGVAKVAVDFKGQGNEIIEFLKSLDGARVNNDKIIDFGKEKNPFSLQLINKKSKGPRKVMGS